MVGVAPTISKTVRSGGTGFIREGVGSVSEIVGACPGLFPDKSGPTGIASAELMPSRASFAPTNPASFRMACVAPTISKTARSGGTGFIREGVGSVSEIVGVCPGLFPDKSGPTGIASTELMPSQASLAPTNPASFRMVWVAPTISKTARSGGTGFIREGVGSVSEIVGGCPGLFPDKSGPTGIASTELMPFYFSARLSPCEA